MTGEERRRKAIERMSRTANRMVVFLLAVWTVGTVGFLVFDMTFEVNADTVPCAIDGADCERAKECSVGCKVCPEKKNCCCLHSDACKCIDPTTEAECCPEVGERTQMPESELKRAPTKEERERETRASEFDAEARRLYTEAESLRVAADRREREARSWTERARVERGGSPIAMTDAPQKLEGKPAEKGDGTVGDVADVPGPPDAPRPMYPRDLG